MAIENSKFDFKSAIGQLAIGNDIIRLGSGLLLGFFHRRHLCRSFDCDGSKHHSQRTLPDLFARFPSPLSSFYFTLSSSPACKYLFYVGGVMVLFLFVIMLVNVGSEERGSEEIFNRPRQVTTSVVFCALLVAALISAVNEGYQGFEKRDANRIQIATEPKD